MLKAVQNHNNYIRYERTITVYEQHAVYDLVLLNTPNFAGQLVCPQFLPQGVQMRRLDESALPRQRRHRAGLYLLR